MTPRSPSPCPARRYIWLPPAPGLASTCRAGSFKIRQPEVSSQAKPSDRKKRQFALQELEPFELASANQWVVERQHACAVVIEGAISATRPITNWTPSARPGTRRPTNTLEDKSMNTCKSAFAIVAALILGVTASPSASANELGYEVMLSTELLTLGYVVVPVSSDAAEYTNVRVAFAMTLPAQDISQGALIRKKDLQYSGQSSYSPELYLCVDSRPYKLWALAQNSEDPLQKEMEFQEALIKGMRTTFRNAARNLVNDTDIIAKRQEVLDVLPRVRARSEEKWEFAGGDEVSLGQGSFAQYLCMVTD